MKETLRQDLNSLVNHPVYGMVQDPEALSLFMSSHVFAVWDFMSLLKALQLRLTGMSVPWTPPPDIDSARFINEIVLCEETDEIYPGVYISHVELYRAAMDEIGADRSAIDTFLDGLDDGFSDLSALDIPPATRDFVANTLETAKLEPHRVAASFLFGRENVIPDMFVKLLSHHTDVEETQISPVRLRMRGYAVKLARWVERRYSPREVHLPDGPRPDAFRVYLERHIEVDGDSHGPMGEKLLMNLCGRHAWRWEEATETALSALRARRAMWTGVMEHIQQSRAQRKRW